MSYETVESLPSLAHPLIVSPFQGERDNEELLPLKRLPYPEIDPTWDGFEFPHLLWVGLTGEYITTVKLTENQVTWLFELVLNHEWSHTDLALTPFSQFSKWFLLELNNLIEKTFEKGKKGIPVPLDPKNPRNALEEQWALAVKYDRGSRLVQEVFAVRSSLLHTPGNGRVSHDFRKQLLAKYKEKYEEYFRGFTSCYEVFDDVARKIGERASYALIHNVLGTVIPDKTFVSILLYLTEQSDDCMHSLATLSYEDADEYFSSVNDMSSRDDSGFYRRKLLEGIPWMEQVFNIKTRRTKKDWIEYSIGSTNTVLYCEYSSSMNIYPTSFQLRGDDFIFNGTQEDLYGNYYLFIESIRQQLTTGIGLVCPFWFWDSSRTCCDGRNRAFLKKVWSRTCPTSNCKLWQRLGCLQK